MASENKTKPWGMILRKKGSEENKKCHKIEPKVTFECYQLFFCLKMSVSYCTLTPGDIKATPPFLSYLGDHFVITFPSLPTASASSHYPKSHRFISEQNLTCKIQEYEVPIKPRWLWSQVFLAFCNEKTGHTYTHWHLAGCAGCNLLAICSLVPGTVIW